MTKNISITLSDYVYDTYLRDIDSNRSQYVERAIIIAGDIDTGATESIKARNIKLVQELREKVEEIRKLKAELGRCKKSKPEDDPEEIKARQFHKGRRMAGLNRKLAERMEF